MKSLRCFFFIALMSPFLLFAQVTITGKVSDKKGVPLFGATVAQKSTNNGTYTDGDGNYSLKVSDPNATLIFSYVGLANKEVALNGKNNC